MGCGLWVMGCWLLVYLWDKLMVGFAFQPTTNDRQPTTDNQQTDNQPLAQLDGASVWECFPALAVSIVCVGDDDKG